MTKNIKEKLNKLIDKETTKDIKYRNEWVERNKAWKEKKKHIEKIFQELVSNKEKKDIRGIFVMPHNNENVIQLSRGHLPIGNKLENTKAIEPEQGASLIFSKSIDGKVICVVYPCKSEQMRPIEDYIIYKVYNSANTITDKKIYKAIKFFFTYSRQTSAAFDINVFESFSLWWHKTITTKRFFALLEKTIPVLIEIGKKIAKCGA